MTVTGRTPLRVQSYPHKFSLELGGQIGVAKVCWAKPRSQNQGGLVDQYHEETRLGCLIYSSGVPGRAYLGL